MKWLGGNWLEKALALIPGNGKKTVISIIVLLATVFSAQAVGMPVNIVKITQWLLDNLKGQSVDQILNGSEMAAFIESLCIMAAVIHKLLKFLKQNYES